MGTFVSNGFFHLISDGHKVIIVQGKGKDRQCIEICDPVLTRYNVEAYRQVIDVDNFGDLYRCQMPGFMELTVDLTLKGGYANFRTDPLIMGVDIFDKLSVIDYLDIINEKIKKGK